MGLARSYNMYDHYYWKTAAKRIIIQRNRFKMLLQKLAGVILLLMCGLMFTIAFKDSGNTDITAVLLFLPMGIYVLCSKQKL